MINTRYPLDAQDESNKSRPTMTAAVTSLQRAVPWLLLVDIALLITILLLIFTEKKIFYFHLIFVLLTAGAFYWQLHAFVLRAGVIVSATTTIIILFVFFGHIQSEELTEIPLLTSILLLVFTIARQRSLAEDALRKANVDLGKRVLARTTDLNQEIIEHRKTEQILSANEEQYRHLVQLSFEAIFIHTEDEIVYLNPVGMALFGLTNPKELQGKLFLEFVHPDERDAVVRSLQHVRQEDRGAPLTERKFIRFDGNEIDVETVTVPIRYNGQAAMQTAIRDISLRKQIEQARFDERINFARDLHDSLGQSLGYLHLKLDAFVDQAPLGTSYTQDLIHMRAVANAAYEQVRGMLATIMPANTMQLAQALRHQANMISQQAQFQAQVFNRGQERMLPAVLQQQILSLCSEALTNVMKHAHARQVKIELWWDHENLTIIIEDDGVGFDTAAPLRSNSFGRRIMQNSAGQMSGQLKIQSQHLAGTKVTLQVPLPSV